MPTKDSSIISVRVRNSVLKVITERAESRGLTINAWLTWAINTALRSHKKSQ